MRIQSNAYKSFISPLIIMHNNFRNLFIKKKIRVIKYHVYWPFLQLQIAQQFFNARLHALQSSCAREQ